MDTQSAEIPTVAVDETESRDAMLRSEREGGHRVEASRESGGALQVMLPGEGKELPASGEGCGVGEAYEAGDQSSESGLGSRRRWPIPRQRRLQLFGAAAAAGLVAAGAWVVWPSNHVHPAPQMASMVRGSVAGDRASPTKPLAPAASLAGVPTLPATPVVRERYRPEQKSQQLQELLALHGGDAKAMLAARGASAGSPAAKPATRKAAAVVMPEAPPGYVPREPGASAHPAAGSTAGQGQEGTGAGVAAAPSPGAPDVTPAVVAALPQALKPAAVSVPAGKSASDPVDMAGGLRAAPMAPHDEVQVLELVTQIATVVRDLRSQDAQLRAALTTARTETSARLDDFERRLALLEAGNAVTAAHTTPAADTGSSPAQVANDSRPAPMPVSAAASQPAVPRAQVDGRQMPAAGALDRGTERLRYRVQAASPGLAMLAEVDRGGGEGAQFEVLVGDKIPGYGKVTSIGQRGTAWVVATEHGDIQ